VAVDDRSTDDTGGILDRLALGEPRLQVVRVTELLARWLGKNHALSVGSAAARGDWLLFTDADVVMQPDTLSRAIGHAKRSGLDHLTVLPDLILPGMLKGFTVGFVVWFSAYVRPWKAKDPKSRFSVGVGAFNLVRATAYRAAGGHEPIRMRPDDDLKLGKILKRSGARSEAMSGLGMISVEWYHSLREAIDGLMKNTFSVVDYYSALLLGGAFFYLLVGLGPMAMLVLGSAPIAVCGGVTIACQLLVHTAAARETNAPWHAGALYPLAALLMAWILIRALVLNLWHGGIIWRGTFYPLTELRKNRV
jgi:glycosyltransferase involved in cell wall biosynthesis